MVVGAAGDELDAVGRKSLRHGLRVGDDLLLVDLEGLAQRLLEADGLGGDHMHQRPALGAGEDGLVDGLGVLLPAENHAAAGAPQRLVGRRGDEIGVGHRVRVQAGGNKARDVGHIHHKVGAHGVGHLTEAGKVDHSRIGAGAGDDHLGLAFLGNAHQIVVIDPLRLLRNAVGYDVEVLAGEVYRAAVCEMPAMGQVHAQNGVTGLQHGKIHGDIGLRAGVGLHIGVLRAKDLAGAGAGQLLHHVHILAAAVIAVAGVTLGVLVGKVRARGGQYGGAHEVLAGDELQMVPLAAQLLPHGGGEFGVGSGDELQVDHVPTSYSIQIVNGGKELAAGPGKPAGKG